MATYAVKCEMTTSFYVYVEAETCWEAEAKADHALAYNPINWGRRELPACRSHIKEHPIHTVRATEVEEACSACEGDGYYDDAECGYCNGAGSVNSEEAA